MQSFQDGFFDKHENEFETEGELDLALESFDGNWWNTKRDELNGPTLNRVVRGSRMIAVSETDMVNGFSLLDPSGLGWSSPPRPESSFS